MNIIHILIISFLAIAIVALLCWCVGIIAYNLGYEAGYIEGSKTE